VPVSGSIACFCRLFAPVHQTSRGELVKQLWLIAVYGGPVYAAGFRFYGHFPVVKVRRFPLFEAATC